MKRTACLAALASLAFLASEGLADDPKPDDEGAGRIYELRVYHTNEGKLDALHKRFREHTMELFRKHGMTNVGYFVPMPDQPGHADTLVYLLSFPSREAADASWKAFGADEEWKRVKAESEKDGVLVKKVERFFLDPTDYSPAAKASAESAGEPRVFELRTYTASPGKFADLHKRFREHTMELFRKHGMTNVAYFVPMKDQPGHEDKLIYLLAFPGRDAAKASWKGFIDDPEWQAVYKASQPDGVPLAGKVESLFLTPTDYSPLK